MDGPDDTHEPAKARSHAVARVIEQVRVARAAGERLADALIISAHGDLMPDLGHELGKLSRIELAWAEAARPSVAIDAEGSSVPVGPAEMELAAALAADLEKPAIEVPGYDVLREIGRGGQAVVFLAVKLNPGRRVALKVMRDGSLADNRALARFRLEAEVLANLNHPNIVTVFETGLTSDGSHYLAMNYIPGCGLDEHMRRRQQKTPDDPSRLLRLFFRICDVVNAAHVQQIVHRDLKPTNIRVDERGEPHILDFGLARTTLGRADGTESVSVTGDFLGSLPWSSPEQAAGDPKQIDVRSDVYSLGVILYQMLTGGRFPYEVVGNVRDVLNTIVTAEPTPPSKIIATGIANETGDTPAKAATHAPAVNEAIEKIVLKALAKHPGQRYQNAGELGRAIADYLLGRKTTEPVQQTQDQPASADPTARGQGSRGMKRRHVVGIVAIFTALAGILWQTLSPEGDPMKPSRLFKSLVLFVSAGAFAATPPKPAPPPAAKPAPAAHHSPLADRLARSEASVRALDHHLATAAELKAIKATDAKLAERARKLARQHEHVPLLWTEYVRHVPGGIIVDNSGVAVFDLEAEKSAAALGNDLGALWARRKQVQAERMILWSKIAFRSVVDMELAARPLYRFELKSGDKPLDVQHMAALNAAVQFVRVADHLAGQAQDAVDTDPQRVFEQWYKLLAAARSGMQDKLLLQALVALDVYKPDTDAGQLAAGAKQLAGLAQTIVDSERTMGAAEIAGDDEEADASRAQFQQALAETAGAVAALDHAIEKAATAWGVTAIPGTKVAVIDLPELLGRPVVSIPIIPGPGPAAPVGPPVERTEMVGNEHSANFTDDAPPGAILVGFEFTTDKVHKVHIVNAARAVYRGPAGEVTGKQLGHPSGTVTRVVARPGYGVVSIDITTGAKHIQGIVVHFMRIDGNVAVPTDAYDASFGPNAGPGRKIGDKRPIVGVFGESGANVDRLGLIILK